MRPISRGYTQFLGDYIRETWIHLGPYQKINIDPYLVVTQGEPQCLNNGQGADCLDQSLVEGSKRGLSTGYSTEHPHNDASCPAYKNQSQCLAAFVRAAFNLVSPSW